MAIIVPFAASALGATALQATLVSVAFAVTGISAKIDKAATKVFGKDMVKLGNVLGAGYAMFNGGFDVGGTPDPAAMNVPTGAESGDLFQQHMAAQGIEPVAIDTTNTVFDRIGAEPAPLTAEAWDAAGVENTAALGDAVGTNLMTGEPVGVDAKVAATNSPAPTASTPITDTTPQAIGALSSQATASNATAAQAAAQTVPTATQAKAAADVLSKQLAPYQQPANIFERLFYTTDKAGNKVFNDRLAGGVIQGLGSAASGYMQSQEAAKGLDWQKQKYGAIIGGRVTG